MRVYQYNQTKKNVLLLQRLCEDLELLFQKNSTKMMSDLLTEIQSSFIEVGNFLEKDDSNQSIVHKIENICEIIWEISQTSTIDEFGNKYKSLRNEIDELLFFLDTNPKEKIKIAFFAYKADMWTSMAPIWELARFDDRFEVQVIIIPYFDIGNGKSAEFIYEINRFPSELKSLNYEKYDLEIEHPEIIFFHNPYDDQNNLTSVYPKFYSPQLKRNSEILVYAPYNTMGTYMPEKNAHLFYAIGIQNSDIVLAQSQIAADIYKKYLSEEVEVLSFGSPKIDYIVDHCKAKKDIPKKWKEKLEGKKVFLLNTHLLYFPIAAKNDNSAGNYAVRYHKQIIDVFLNNEKCALIWRPHPLLKAMIYDRFPQCIEFVEWFEKQVSKAPNGIVDDTSDYIEAFNCSDAMISTWSSLINEYMVTGKPILIFQKPLKKEIVDISPINRNVNYFIHGTNKVRFDEFRDLIINDNDYMKQKRLDEINISFPNYGKNASKQILQYIINRLR